MPRLLIDGTALSPQAKGVGRYSHRLIEQLTRRLGDGWSITVLYTETPAPTFSGPLRPALRRIPPVPEMVRGMVLLPILTLATRSDLVLVPMDGTAMTAGRPRITVVHDIAELIDIASLGRSKQGLLAKLRRYFMGRSLRTAAAVVCNSEFTAREAVARYGIPPENVRIGYCGVDERFYEPDLRSAREHWPRIADWSGYVLTFATGDPRESYDLCPDIWARVREQMGDVGLVIAGVRPGSEYLEALTAAFRQRGLREDKDVMFVPFLGEAEFDALRALYRGADFYLELSGHEGFGMQLAEAMATGTTCVSSGRGALREIGGDYAIVADAFDAPAFAHTLVDAYRRAQHARDNREQIAWTRRFNWDAVGETVAAELERLRHAARSGSAHARP